MHTVPKQFQILDEGTRNKIHKTALKILAKTGFRVYSPEMRQRLAEAGAVVDDQREVVALPAELVTDALANTPSEFTLYDLAGRPVRHAMGTVRETIATYTEAVMWLDYGADKLRPAKLADLQQALKIADALPLVSSTGIIVHPTDVPVERQLKESLKALLTTTQKSPHLGLQNEEQARTVFDAFSVAAPGLDMVKKPPLLFVCSPTSPLMFDKDSAEALIFCLDRGLIPTIAPCPMAGGTSQFSIIGTVLQQVVESLFVVCAKFAIAPEAPISWGGAAAAMDMRVGDVSYGGIERSLMMLANIDMAVHYNIPCNSPAASVDSCLIDAQLGVEKTWTYMTRYLSNAASGIGIGAITNGKAVSAEQMVIDNDIIRCVDRFARGIEIDHMAKAAQEIMEVAHGGNFMMAEATVELMRSEEYYYPATFNRAGTDAAPSLERAHAEVKRILSEWTCPVPDSIREDLERHLA